MINTNKKILIVGLGLLGGSYAMGLTDAGYYVAAIDKNPEAIKYGLEHKIIKDGKTIVQKEFVEQFDLVIFGLYPKVFVEWLRLFQSYLKTNAIITDVTGIKTWLINEIESFLREDISFVAHHPMAGKEVYGVENADKNMFLNANFIITPSNSSTLELFAFLNSFLFFSKAYATKNPAASRPIPAPGISRGRYSFIFPTSLFQLLQIYHFPVGLIGSAKCFVGIKAGDFPILQE